MTRQRLLILLCLWVIVAVTFLVVRSSTGLVWDDTNNESANLYRTSAPLQWDFKDILQQISTKCFLEITAGGYRPLSYAISRIGTAFFSTPENNPVIWFAFVGMLFAFAAVCIFLVSRRCLKTDIGALLAVFLFLFSTPVITGAWIVFAGIQIIVPLMICIGLLLYWRVIEASRHRGWYVFGLCVVLFTGPWFREFIGFTLPLLLIFVEFQRVRRPTALMGVIGIFLLHGIFPTAIVKLLVYPHLPLLPIFSMAELGVRINFTFSIVTSPDLPNVIGSIRWAAANNFLTLFPSALFALALIAYVTLAVTSSMNMVKKIRLANSSPHRLRRWINTEIGKTVLLPIIFIVTALVGYLYFPGSRMFPFWLTLGVAFIAIQYDTLLAWWFLLSFLPTLLVYTEQVHLTYALLPASIVIAAAVENLWQKVRQLRPSLHFARYAVIVLMVLVIADHGLNLYGSYRVVNSINDGISKTAEWFKNNVTFGSIVVANALHAEDIMLYSSGHITPYWTVTATVPVAGAAVTAEAKGLEKLIKNNQGKYDVYFLDMDHAYGTMGKYIYHSHKYVRDQSVAMEDLGIVHVTRVFYPYLDPCKAYVPVIYISFLGPPDLENDFYRGPAQDGTPFLREVYVEYHVYKVTGTEVDPWEPIGLAQLVKQDYRGFNIVELNGRYFAIPWTEGVFEYDRAWQKKFSKSFISDSYQGIINQIDLAFP